MEKFYLRKTYLYKSQEIINNKESILLHTQDSECLKAKPKDFIFISKPDILIRSLIRPCKMGFINNYILRKIILYSLISSRYRVKTMTDYIQLIFTYSCLYRKEIISNNLSIKNLWKLYITEALNHLKNNVLRRDPY